MVSVIAHKCYRAESCGFDTLKTSANTPVSCRSDTIIISPSYNQNTLTSQHNYLDKIFGNNKYFRSRQRLYILIAMKLQWNEFIAAFGFKRNIILL